jgi:hypothetical protein
MPQVHLYDGPPTVDEVLHLGRLLGVRLAERMVNNALADFEDVDAAPLEDALDLAAAAADPHQGSLPL